MLPIQWKDEAQADLAAILNHIAQHSRQGALDLFKEIDRAISHIPHNPYLYRAGRVAGTRELVVQANYVVVYRVGPVSIEILSVAHTRQRYP